LWDREQMRHGETCYLVRPGDPEAMREAIEYLWAHPEEAARIGRNARLLVETRATSDQFGRDLAGVIGRWAV
jgi:rhamnosyl/mannosyltransferase